MSTYQRLQFSEREEISRGLSAYWTVSRIATRLRRSVSTVSSEIKRNCKYKRTYRAIRAHGYATAIRHRTKQPKKIDQPGRLKEYVLEKLRIQWSPEEIARRVRLDYADDTTMRISHESIYTYIYCLPKGELRKELLKCLRQERAFRYSRKRSHAKRAGISEAISISERPAEVKDRIIPGHWEGDLILGKNHKSAVGTLVERTTRYLLLVPLAQKDALSVRLAFARAVKRIPRHLKQSLTYDRGNEMAEHKLFTQETKIQVYFADPHSPWQRGTNENTNGLIRQYFPKGTDFSTVGKARLREVQDRLNDRPRKALHFLKPDEAFTQLLIT